MLGAGIAVIAVLGVAIAVALALDLSINVSFNPTRSLITDVTPEGIARTRGYTWMQTVSGSFGVLAYAIGAIFGNYLLIYFAGKELGPHVSHETGVVALAERGVDEGEGVGGHGHELDPEFLFRHVYYSRLNRCR